MSLHFRKGLCPLVLPSEPPTPVPGTSPGAGGRGRPLLLEPPWERGLSSLASARSLLAGCASRPSRSPRPSWRLCLISGPPSLHTNPEPLCSQAPRGPSPACPPPPPACPLFWIRGPGGWAGRGLRAGGGGPPTPFPSLGNADKPGGMLAPRLTPRRRCSLLGAGGHLGDRQGRGSQAGCVCVCQI